MLRKIKHIYDVIGCDWNMPANYGASVFENCQGDSGEVWYQIYPSIWACDDSLASQWASMELPRFIKATQSRRPHIPYRLRHRVPHSAPSQVQILEYPSRRLQWVAEFIWISVVLFLAFHVGYFNEKVWCESDGHEEWGFSDDIPRYGGSLDRGSRGLLHAYACGTLSALSSNIYNLGTSSCGPFINDQSLSTKYQYK